MAEDRSATACGSGTVPTLLRPTSKPKQLADGHRTKKTMGVCTLAKLVKEERKRRREVSKKQTEKDKNRERKMKERER